MESSFKRLHNILFISIISILTALVLGLVVLAVSIVLYKGLPNLWASFSTPEIQFSIKLSLFTSIISTLLCLVFAIPIGYVLVKLDFKGKKIINLILQIPMSLPPIVSGISLLMVFGNTEIGRLLQQLGLRFVFDVKGIVLAEFFVNVPYMIRIMKSTLSEVDSRMEFISRTLGCTRAQSFFKVTLPIAKNGLIASTIVTWSRSLGEFGAILMLAGATRMKTETLTMSIYLNIARGDLELALSVAAMLIIISIISLMIFEVLGDNKRF